MSHMKIGDGEIDYFINPNNEVSFKEQLIKHRRAVREYFYNDGTSSSDTWDVSKFNENTPIRSSISNAVKQKQKKEKKTIVKVIVTVEKDESSKLTYLKLLKNLIIKKFPNFVLEEESIEKLKDDFLFLKDENNRVLIIKINKTKADRKSFYELSDIMGKIIDLYPDKKVEGLIIGKSIDESLKKICLSNNNISLKEYEMDIILKDVTKE